MGRIHSRTYWSGVSLAVAGVLTLVVFSLFVQRDPPARAAGDPDVHFPEETAAARSSMKAKLDKAPVGDVAAKKVLHNSCNTDVAQAPGGVFYLGCRDDRIYSVSATGGVAWVHRAWRDVDSSPTVAPDGTMYAGSDSGYLYALSPSGRLKWKRHLGSLIFSSPTVGPDGTVYAGSRDNHLYAIDPKGAVKWRLNLGHDVDSSPAVGPDGTIYVGADNRHFHAVTPKGRLKWKIALGGIAVKRPLLTPDGGIYVATPRQLTALDAKGRIRWQKKFKGTMADMPVLVPQGYLLLWTSKENLVVVTRKGQTVRSVRFGLNVTGYLKRLSGGQLCVAASNGLVVVMSAMGVPIWKVRVPFGIKGRPAGPISQRLVVPTSRGIVWVAPPI